MSKHEAKHEEKKGSQDPREDDQEAELKTTPSLLRKWWKWTFRIGLFLFIGGWVASCFWTPGDLLTTRRKTKGDSVDAMAAAKAVLDEANAKLAEVNRRQEATPSVVAKKTFTVIEAPLNGASDRLVKLEIEADGKSQGIAIQPDSDLRHWTKEAYDPEVIEAFRAGDRATIYRIMPKPGFTSGVRVKVVRRAVAR